MIIAKAALLNREDSSEVDSYNKLINTYKTAMFDDEIEENSNNKMNLETLMENKKTIFNQKKVQVNLNRVEKNFNSADLKELIKDNKWQNKY